MIILKLTLYLLLINGIPVVASRLLGKRFSMALDLGLSLPDGRRLLGESKTWRGLILATLAAALVAPAVGLSLMQGAAFGLASLLGDAMTSFLKRRLAMPPHAHAPVLDQTLEVILPLWWLHEPLGIGLHDGLAVWALFLGCHIILSPLLYRLGVRLVPW